MRSFVLASAVLGLAAAAPAPQDIDFALADALANPTFTVASDATAQTVTYTPTAIFESAIAQITATNTDDLPTTTTDSANKVKRSDCAPQASGYGPTSSPDTVAGFLGNTNLWSAAVNAPVPSGYTQTFSNLTASNNAMGYLGYTTLKSYDSAGCAAKCNAINGCMSVNIYFERDPSVDPGSGTTCQNPSSTNNIKCVFWGGPINSGNANNAGQYRNQFQVVIAGSNGYVNNTIAQVPGYTTAVDLGTSAINAPYDTYGFNSYMGSAIFNNGPFNASLCAQACTTKSQYALANPPTDGSPVQTCQFFNTYILYINNTANPNSLQGQYCAMYSESWSSSYATNVGQYRTNAAGGQDHYLIEYSYSYSNSTNAGTANPVAAEYQAKTDILWPGNSALPYCSSILGYTTPLTTTTSTSTVTPTSTVQATATVVVNVKRQDGSANPLLVPSVASTQSIAARQAASTPAVLTKYPASIITSACKLAATPVSSTSTITVLATATASPQTVTNTVTVSSTTTTTQPTPTNPSMCSAPNTCSTGFQPNCGSDCYCVQNSSGGGTCVKGEVRQDGSTICNLDSDCPSGDFCFRDSCRGNVCVTTSWECTNTANAKMLFRRTRRDTVFNSLLGTDVAVSSS